MARLLDTKQGTSWELGPRTTIGRSPKSTIPVEDQLVSRLHAEIRQLSETSWQVIDLGSSYGTFVGGHKISEHTLAHGEEIQVGVTTFRFDLGARSSAGSSSGARIGSTSTSVQERTSASGAFLPADSLQGAEEIQQAYERLRAALEISHHLSAERELQPLLENILGEVFRMVRADRVAVLLMESGKLIPRIARDREGADSEVVLSQSILDEVVSTREAVLSADAGEDARFEASASIRVEGIRSAMSVPLLYRDDLLGVLHADSRMATAAFTRADLELFGAVAAQVALAIRNFQMVHAWNEELQTQVDERTRELKEAQELLLGTQKAAAMSSLGAGMAHEINNPLTGILGMTQLLIRKSEGSQARMLETIEKEARRIKEIVSTLQKMSEEYSGRNLEPVDVASLVDGAIQSVAGRLEQAQVEVVRELGAHLPRIPADESSLQQALLHVINNAIAAMPDGGTLTIRVAARDGVVSLSVVDTGVGMSQEVLGRIFDPFFTTKSEWQSKGLGLPVAYRIVQEHGGRIRVDSSPGAGTTVSITLPTASRAAHLE